MKGNLPQLSEGDKFYENRPLMDVPSGLVATEGLG